jgi:hypothetical protein
MIMLSQLASFMLPWWARALAIAFIAVSVFLLGQLHGERVAGEKHLDYISKQAAASIKIVQAQAKVVIETQVKYVDRFKTVYIKGETIEKQVPIYITAADNAACSINAGFVHVYNAAWSGNDTGSAADSDREPSELSLVTLAEADAHNATSCIAWREQALGLREFYKKLQLATNKQP